MKTTSPLSNSPLSDENPQALGARRPSRWFVVATVLLMVFLTLGLVGSYLLLRHSQVVRVARIGGSSMEPALRGPRLELLCSKCQSTNAWTYDAWNPRREVRCRFCREYLETSDPKLTQGETIRYFPTLHRKPPTARHWRPRDDRAWTGKSDLVNRWGIIVLKTRDEESPQEIKANQIKRVVGLPGETIRIAHGRIYADGQPVVPTLMEFMQQAVVIADWELDSKSPSKIYSSKTLEGFLSGIAAPIDNALPINAHDSHQPVAVGDIGIGLRLAQPQSNWNLKFQLGHGDQRIPIEISCYEKDAQVTLMVPGAQEEIGSEQAPWPQIGLIRSWQPTWIHVVVLGGRLIILDERQERWSVALGPIKEGLCWTELSLVDPPGLIDRCMIYRGLHYRGVRDTPEQEFAASEGWIVLGDNGTISEDSRYWEQPRVVRDELMGILEPPTGLIEGLVKQLPQ